MSPPTRSLRSTVRFTGSTHDTGGYITKHPPTVDALNRHLSDKIEAHRDEIELVDADTEPGAETLVVGYGVTGGAVRAAVAEARARQIAVSGLVVQSLWPVPEEAIRRAMHGVGRIVVAELNLGLYRREIERIAGDRRVVGVNRIDGGLIEPAEIIEAMA